MKTLSQQKTYMSSKGTDKLHEIMINDSFWTQHEKKKGILYTDTGKVEIEEVHAKRVDDE